MKKAIYIILCLSFSFQSCNKDEDQITEDITPVVSTFAGSIQGYKDGAALQAQFNSPMGIAVTNDGTIYVADSYNNVIRKIAPTGEVTTLAGNTKNGFADGDGEKAMFSYPTGVAVNNDGEVFITDRDNNVIRKISSSGMVNTVAGNGQKGYKDGSGQDASFDSLNDIAIDKDGDIYVVEANRIRKISKDGMVSTIAGSESPGYADGEGSMAKFSGASGITIAENGDIYVIDSGNNNIRRVTKNGAVTTLTINNIVKSFPEKPENNQGEIEFNYPFDLVMAKDGNIYISDTFNNTIRKLSPNGMITTIAGDGDLSGGLLDGEGRKAKFTMPFSIALSHDGKTLYISDTGNNVIRKIVLTN